MLHVQLSLLEAVGQTAGSTGSSVCVFVPCSERSALAPAAPWSPSYASRHRAYATLLIRIGHESFQRPTTLLLPFTPSVLQKPHLVSYPLCFPRFPLSPLSIWIKNGAAMDSCHLTGSGPILLFCVCFLFFLLVFDLLLLLLFYFFTPLFNLYLTRQVS